MAKTTQKSLAERLAKRPEESYVPVTVGELHELDAAYAASRTKGLAGHVVLHVTAGELRAMSHRPNARPNADKPDKPS